MNIIFTKLPTTDGTIKISLDGGQSFTDYSIANIPEDGISLSDDQDYEKIRIKGPANILKNLSIVSGVKVEGASGESGENGGSVKLYAFSTESSDLYAYTFSETLKDGDKVFYGMGGDAVNELHFGTIALSYESSMGNGAIPIENGFIITNSQCTYIDGYTIFTRVNDKDIELTINSSGSDVDLSEYVQKEYFQGELYDGGCGYGYRITSYPEGFNSDNADILYNLYLEGGTTLGRLCEYDGHFDAFYGYEPPTGQLFIKLEYQDGCPGNYKYVPTRYFLKSTNNTSN